VLVVKARPIEAGRDDPVDRRPDLARGPARNRSSRPAPAVDQPPEVVDAERAQQAELDLLAASGSVSTIRSTRIRLSSAA
jgi:hypothetical protein